jgi:hypothetical protein
MGDAHVAQMAERREKLSDEGLATLLSGTLSPIPCHQGAGWSHRVQVGQSGGEGRAERQVDPDLVRIYVGAETVGNG